MATRFVPDKKCEAVIDLEAKRKSLEKELSCIAKQQQLAISQRQPERSEHLAGADHTVQSKRIIVKPHNDQDGRKKLKYLGTALELAVTRPHLSFDQIENRTSVNRRQVLNAQRRMAEGKSAWGGNGGRPCLLSDFITKTIQLANIEMGYGKGYSLPYFIQHVNALHEEEHKLLHPNMPYEGLSLSQESLVDQFKKTLPEITKTQSAANAAREAAAKNGCSTLAYICMLRGIRNVDPHNLYNLDRTTLYLEKLASRTVRGVQGRKAAGELEGMAIHASIPVAAQGRVLHLDCLLGALGDASSTLFLAHINDREIEHNTYERIPFGGNVILYVTHSTVYDKDVLYTEQFNQDILPLIISRQAAFKQQVPEADSMAAILTDGGGSNMTALVDEHGNLTPLANKMVASEVYAEKFSSSMSSAEQAADKAKTFAILKTLVKSNEYLSSNVDELERCCGAIKQAALIKFRALKIPAASKRVFERFLLNCDAIFSKASTVSIRQKAWRVSCAFPRYPESPFSLQSIILQIHISNYLPWHSAETKNGL